MSLLYSLVRLRVAAVFAASLAIQSQVAFAQSPMVDATGNSLVIADSGSVVSVGGSVTEIVYALGLADRVLAVDSTSLFPAEATDLPNVGYMRQLAAEPILAMGPSLILAVEDSGPPAVLEQLRDAGQQIVLVPDDPTPQGISNKIRLIADAMAVSEKGLALSRKVESDLKHLKQAVADVGTRPKVLFLLSIGNGGAPLAAGNETSAAGIIELAGGVNAVDAFKGYKALSPEALVEAAPDVLLVTNRSLTLLGGSENLMQVPEIAETPAGRDGRIVSMDGLLLLGFGPRTPLAIEQLAAKLHPDFAGAMKKEP
ncbi:hemin ABC transporter substrate-binding protein [Pelagibius sp. Alg239-R121]|uniref:heme/hemin ABC transporter substrate-binding protein n=1 Tax=Pelagibius sp. Alg239-R121 TaxID=2993448 RepID=UPI0024A6C8BA|nr:ABC transporter substrate-binding protein [Pelagibius sp. Alg239-R121]